MVRLIVEMPFSMMQWIDRQREPAHLSRSAFARTIIAREQRRHEQEPERD